ncbi:unnamed protein product [Discula destructiva]
MNGGATSNHGYDHGRLSPIQAAMPGPKQIMAGYRKHMTNGSVSEKPRYNPSSHKIDLSDPIQVHLLTETALHDSKKWEVLSQEEVDDLKKQIQSLTLRIEQARANLAIQMKYRDAATAMTRLYNSAKRMTVDPKAVETQMEREASERDCEQLATELFDLEKRIMEPQRRLLQHTAGILQLTHRASSKKHFRDQGIMQTGMPGSPESLYMYTEGRTSSSFSNDDIDDRSLYFPTEYLDSAQSPKTDITIPPRSPVRQRTNQLMEELESLKRESQGQLEKINFTERSLQDLNNQLRDLVIEMNPAQHANYKPVPAENAEPGVLVDQLDYLTEALTVIQEGQRDHQLQLAESLKKSDDTIATLGQTEERIRALNRQVHDVISSGQADHPAPPESSGSGLDEHFEWMDRSIPALQAQLERSASSSTGLEEAKQMETVLAGLWNIIQSGYADINRQREARKEVRLGKGLPDDDDDVSADEAFEFDEPYSLNAFSAKVQWLFRQATGLKEQKSVLKRQIRQQREMNSRSDSDKDIELRSKTEELQRTKNLLAFTEENAGQAKRDAEDTQKKLDQALIDLETLQTTHAANSVNNNDEQLRERNLKISALEAESKYLQEKLELVETQLDGMNAQLADVDQIKHTAAAETRNLQEEIKARDDELEQLHMTMVELKTEVTIARAELDGAYGSRSERAAEAAALTKNTQMQDMRTEIASLKGELAETVKELENVTRETVASERERNELEGRLDELTASRGSLEAEIGNLQKEIAAVREKQHAEVAQIKEQLEAEKFKAGPNATGTGPRAGATALSEQFRATMKEERKKFQLELREEQARRRKVEDELRALKRPREQGEPARSARESRGITSSD